MTALPFLAVVPDAAYAVTECPTCDAFTALVVLPPVYVCAACGETGDAGASANHPHFEADEAARARYRELHDGSRVVKEFTRCCTRYRKDKLSRARNA